MYQIFKDQIEKSKLIITGVKRNQRLGRDVGVEESMLQKMDEAHSVLNALKSKTQTVKKAVKSRYDQTWWTKFGIPDRR